MHQVWGTPTLPDAPARAAAWSRPRDCATPWLQAEADGDSVLEETEPSDAPSDVDMSGLDSESEKPRKKSPPRGPKGKQAAAAAEEVAEEASRCLLWVPQDPLSTVVG